MTEDADRLPDGFVSSFEFIHPKDLIEELKQVRAPKQERVRRPSTIWALGNEMRPVDLYCYLGARFGPPNGIQNFLRQDSSDNLIHWEWHLKTCAGQIKFAGMNFRTEVWISGARLPDSEKKTLLRQIQADLSGYRDEMKHIREEHLEEWVEFVNPYQRLRKAVTQQMEELDGLKLNPKADSLPSLLDSKDIDAASAQWRDRAADYTRAVGISFGLRAMIPVMAESFVNLLLFVLMVPSVRGDKQFRDGIFRQQMSLRIRSLPYYCMGFKGPVDTDNAAVQAYVKLIQTRNDLLHGNINVERLKFNELYFDKKVPVFNNYMTMWERGLGVSHRAVGLEEVHKELAVVDAFVEYLLSLLKDSVAEEVRMISEKFDLGLNRKTGRLGVLFGDRLADFGLPSEQPDLENKTLHMRMVVDGPPPYGQAAREGAATGGGGAAESVSETPGASEPQPKPVAPNEPDVQTPASDLGP